MADRANAASSPQDPRRALLHPPSRPRSPLRRPGRGPPERPGVVGDRQARRPRVVAASSRAVTDAGVPVGVDPGRDRLVEGVVARGRRRRRPAAATSPSRQPSRVAEEPPRFRTAKCGQEMRARGGCGRNGDAAPPPPASGYRGRDHRLARSQTVGGSLLASIRGSTDCGKTHVEVMRARSIRLSVVRRATPHARATRRRPSYPSAPFDGAEGHGRSTSRSPSTASRGG